MPDEGPEQQTLVLTGAEEAAPEAPAGAVEAAVEPASGDSGAVSDAPVTFVPDLSTDAGISAALEAYPNLKGFLTKREADAANTARQRRDAELRRDQGANERAQQYHEWLVSELEKGTPAADLARQTPTWVKANEDVAVTNVMRALLRQAGELDETAKGLAETLEGTPDELTKVAQVTLDAAIKRARGDERAALEAERQKFEAETEAKYRAKYEADLAAALLEAQLADRTNPPNVQGSAPSLTEVPYYELSPAERMALSPAERDARVAALVSGAR